MKQFVFFMLVWYACVLSLATHPMLVNPVLPFGLVTVVTAEAVESSEPVQIAGWTDPIELIPTRKGWTDPIELIPTRKGWTDPIELIPT